MSARFPEVVRKTAAGYWGRVRGFNQNARLYLLSAAIAGVGTGVFRLLFNPYALALGFTKANLGEFASAVNMTALVVSLPLGLLADVLGRKRALVLRSASLGLGVSLIVFFHTYFALLAGNVLVGVGLSLLRVVQSPFLAENSTPANRPYLFSLTSATRMAAMFVGNLVGGALPHFFGAHFGIAISQPVRPYVYSIGLAAVAIWASVFPLFALTDKTPHRHSKAEILAPIAHMVRQRGVVAKVAAPYLLISFGAGLFMPFMNVFYMQKFHLSTAEVGTLFALGSLMMGAGFFIAPPLADKLGKVRLVAFSQGLSIPFLAIMGFAPWYWLSALGYLMRLLLMNMSNPQYNAFVMEQVSEESRALTSSTLSMIWNFGRAISPLAAGYIWEKFGFSPLFVGAGVLYSFAVALYVPFFLLKGKGKVPSG